MEGFVRKHVCMRWTRGAQLAALLGGLGLVSAASAGSFEFMDGTSASYKLTLGYALAMRMKDPAQGLINGPIDPFQDEVLPSSPGQPTQVVGFTHTGLQNTLNFDDGDRNFKKYGLINDRISAYGEFSLKHDNYGAIFSGSAFYDNAYRRKNHNNSLPFGPGSTVNKTGTPNEFTEETRHYDGQRARLLEAYAYGDWNIGEQGALDLRLGQQLVAWGESLFFSGVALAQGPADASKAFVPGAEVKDILLPVNQVAARLAVNDKLTLLGQYKLAYKATELFPEGDFFSPADLIGPGATFGYGSANPATLTPGSCVGLVPDQLCGLESIPALSALLTQVGLGVLKAPPYILVTRNPDINPSKHGQYGLGIKYNLTPTFNLGLFRLRYHDTNPAIVLTTGFAPIAYPVAGGPPVTTSIINQVVPVSYAIKYFDGIDMSSLSWSTVAGPFNIAGEFNYRQHMDTQVQAVISGVLSPVYTRSNMSQALISSIYAANPGYIVDDLAVVTEAGIIHVNSVEAIQSSAGIIPVGNGAQLMNDATSSGIQLLAIGGNHNVFAGWDLSNQLSYAQIIKGNPSMAGAFGSLIGQGDKRLGLSTGLTYLGNLQITLGYNFFFGNPDKRVR
ncbi:MAG: DUF1302 domain-containing protein, partial [Stenotrophobium sp.]